MTRRWLPGILAALVAILALTAGGAWLLVELTVDAELLERIAGDLLAGTSGGLYGVEIGDLDKSLVRGGVVARDVRLRADPEARRRLVEEGAAPALQFELHVDEVGLEGVDLLRLAWRRDLVADRFFVESPRLRVLAQQQLVGTPSTAEEEDRRLRERAAPEPGDTLHQRVARGLPHVAVDRIDIEDVALSLKSLSEDGAEALPGEDTRPRDTGPDGAAGSGTSTAEERIEGISIHLRDLRVDPDSAGDPERVLYSEDVLLEIDRYARLLGGGSHEVEVGPIRASTGDGTFRFERLAYRPTSSESEFLDRAGGPDDRVEVEAGPVRVTGMQYRRLIERLHLVADSLLIERLELSVLEDERKQDSDPGGRPGMPHDFFQSLGTLLQVEAVELGRGRVSYAERAADGARPGQITFAGISGRITNVTNDPDRMSPASPAVAELRARVEGDGGADLRLRWELPLLSPRPTMSYSGRLEEFDARLLNSLLPDLEGMRIRDGHVSWLEFDVRVDPAVATGAVTGIYRDLSVSFEDKATGGRSLGDRLKSFAANTFAIRGDSEPGPDGHPRNRGRVRYELRPDDPFFAVVWKALRSGLLDLVKR
ncbi:MAG: hypothetical protein ACOC5E_03710 [Acidobacteriota bacterium]